jgi:hypothetical protein
MTVIVWYFISTYAICPSSLQWQGELYAMKYEKKIKTVMVNNSTNNLGEAANTNFIVFGLNRQGLKLTIYCT